MGKKFYWLKVKEDFFDDKHIRYLRKMPDGDRLVIVYLRMQLYSLKTEGIIEHSNLLPTCAEELALSLDEDVEIVKFALAALEKIGLIEIWSNQTVYMAAMQPNIGREGESAERVRRHRERKALQCNGGLLPSNPPVTNGNTELELERREQSQELRDRISLSPPSDSTKKKAAPVFDDDSVEIVLSKLLYDSILQNDSKFKEPDLQKWAKNIDKLMRLDGRERVEIESVILWCQQDSFWCSNILSTGKLRKQFPALLSKMKNAGRHGAAQTDFSNPDNYKNLTMEV